MRLLPLLLVIALSGCLSSSPEPVLEPEPTQPPEPIPEPVPEDEPTGRVEGFVRDANGPVPGAAVSVVGWDLRTTSGANGDFVFAAVPLGTQTLRALHGERTTERSVEVTEGGGGFVFLDLAVVLEPSNETEPEPAPAPGYAFSCDAGPVVEPQWTHGKGDTQFPEMTWAALKTGFRFAVALPGVGDATIDYKVQGGPSRSVTTTSGLFVLEGLQSGKDICFTVTAGGVQSDLHAARLVNGPGSYDAKTGTYTLNLLGLAAERPARSEIEGGLIIYAETLWDSTDGLVRPGATILVYGGPDRMEDAYEPCSTPGVAFRNPAWDGLLCDKVYDFGVTHFVTPVAAASTYLDGISEASIWIRMNAVFEASTLTSYTHGDDVEFGRVLTHELGHYAFGMQDMYVDGGTCYDSTWSLSIMGSEREATEFDDADHPCPNAATLDGYVPAWTDFMKRFQAAKDRPDGPLPGPAGGADLHTTTVLDLS